MADQFRKSCRASWAYLLVSNTSVALYLPAVTTSRSPLCEPPSWFKSGATASGSPPRSTVWRMNSRAIRV